MRGSCPKAAQAPEESRFPRLSPLSSGTILRQASSSIFRQLAESFAKPHPEAKLLFASGYTEDIIAHRGVLEDGFEFVAKPYTLASLGAKVREALAST